MWRIKSIREYILNLNIDRINDDKKLLGLYDAFNLFQNTNNDDIINLKENDIIYNLLDTFSTLGIQKDVSEYYFDISQINNLITSYIKSSSTTIC